jgi:hypothetical protein
MCVENEAMDFLFSCVHIFPSALPCFGGVAAVLGMAKPNPILYAVNHLETKES